MKRGDFREPLKLPLHKF